MSGDQRKQMDPRMIEALINAYPQIKDQIRRDIRDEFVTSEVAKQGWPRILIDLKRGEKPSQSLIDAWNHHLRVEDFLCKRILYWLEWGDLLEKEFNQQNGQLMRLRWKPPIIAREVEADGIAKAWERELNEEEDETRHALFDLVPFKGDPIVASILREADGESRGNVPEVRGIEREYLDLIRGRGPPGTERLVPDRTQPAASVSGPRVGQPQLPYYHVPDQAPSTEEPANAPSRKRKGSKKPEGNKQIPFRERKPGRPAKHRSTGKRKKEKEKESEG
jgi:hypothetical protein